MRLQLSSLFIFPFLLGSHQYEINPEHKEEIDSMVQSYMANNNIPGLGLSVIKTNGEVSYTRGYGMANIENSIPVSNGTLFVIGSITKSFTATLVVKTLNEIFPELGERALDTPIRKLTPSYNFTLNDRYRSEQTTLRDLLAHRVCADYDGTGVISGAFQESKDVFFRQRYVPEHCSFRTAMCYDNNFIAMAADIAAHIANRSVDDLFQDFFDEIGMQSTTWVKETDDHNNMVGRSVPYIWRNKEFQRYDTELLKNAIPVKAAGLLLTSPSDMTKYMELHLNYGRIGDKQIIPSDVISWMYKISSEGWPYGTVRTEANPNATLDMATGYGLSLEKRLYDGWLRIGHPGFYPPYQSYMSLFLDAGVGIFLTTNGPGATFDKEGMSPHTIHNRIFDILNENKGNNNFIPAPERDPSYDPFLGGVPSPTPVQLDLPIPLWNSSPSSKILTKEEIVGTFGHGLGGNFEITLRNNSRGVEKPYLQYGRAKGWMNRFFNTNTFHMNEWDSDFWMIGWTIGFPKSLPITLRFEDEDNLNVTVFLGFPTSHFVRDLGLPDLPEIPWDPESC